MISDPFIRSLITRIDSPNVIGIGLVGSFAREQENQYSDVDLDIFVGKLPERQYDRYTLRYWDNYLVSLKYLLLEDEHAAFSNPERAIWAIPGLRQMKILLDKDGSLASLQKDAQTFEWKSLQPAADEFAAEQIMGCAEEVRKILSGLANKHESTVLYAAWGLVSSMLRAVCVQRGLFIESENLYFDIIQGAFGQDSKWVHAFRTAWGLEPASFDQPQFQVRGASALSLYHHTARMFNQLIPNEHRGVVRDTLRLIEEAGY